VKQRTFAVFRAYVMDDTPAAEVARRFGMKENAVYQVKDRMLRRLEQELRALLREIEDLDRTA